jgi:uncharacterized protein involved in exopolysaccharide biosynthesis
MTATREQEREISLVGVFVVLLRQRRVIALVAMLGVALGIAAGLLARRSYTASASFTLQTSDGGGLSRVAGIAAQLGLPTGLGGQTGQSPEFYADLLTSRQLLRQVVDTRFTSRQAGQERAETLIELLEVDGATPELKRERAADHLRDQVGAVATAKTGMVEVWCRLPEPGLAAQVLGRMLELLNDFNLRTRQSQARAERRFVEGRLKEVEGELRAAEDRLQAFLQRNRDFRNSPQLTFTVDRLQRDVAMRQQVYVGLAQSYEQSRIDEVRDTPVITMVETVATPVEPDSRRLLVRAILGLLLGGMLGVLAGFAREFSRRRREAGDATYDDLVTLRRQAMEDLKRPWRILRPAGP